MKVLMLLSQTEITGAEVHAVQLGQWLSEAGHSVFLISDTLNMPTTLSYTQKPIHPKGFLNRLSNILFLRRFIEENQIDILHAHSRAAVRVGFWTCWLSRAALVSTVHGRQHFSWSKKVFNLYGRHIIAVCKNIKTHLHQDFGLRNEYISVIGNPVHMTASTTGIPTNSIAVVGRTSGPKGDQTKRLIDEVFPKLLEKFPDLKIHLLGGPVATLGSEALNRIEFLNKKYPGCITSPATADLDQALPQYCLIFGAGRVAISALLQGVPVWAIGENISLGIVTGTSFSEICKSNFGDIGLTQAAPPFKPDEMIQRLTAFLQSKPEVGEESKALQLAAKARFDFSNAAKKIENIYKAALFYKNYRKSIPILMYHMVTPSEIETRHKIFVTTERFDQQLRAYKKWGYQTLQFKDIDDFSSGKRDWSQFPRKPLMITFDDGYTNNLTQALPLLQKYQMKAVIYLLANNQLKNNFWDEGEIPLQNLMTAEERRTVFESGHFEIGSHGLEHKPLTQMTEKEAFHQLRESKLFLDNEFGISILSYAFTYGLRTDELAETAFNAGYNYIINTDQGGFHLSQPVTSIFRTPIFPQDQGFKLWRKVQPWYRKYFYFTRKK